MNDGLERRTWDGLAIAPDNPLGSTVTVRRHRPGHRPEFLLLHRQGKGADFEGDWAWTSPAGARQPGEAVYPAALRELAEEAGLTGLLPWAVDLAGPSGAADPALTWAVFAVDVPAETEVELVDPEHDRYQWLPADEARGRILPAWVARRQIDMVAAVPPVRFTFRALTHDDLPDVVAWQRAPHVREWFGGGVDLAEARARYGPRIDQAARAAVRMWVVEYNGVSVGYVQDYRVGDHDEYAVKTRDPDAVAFDYVVGRPDRVGQGLGTAMIWAYLRDIVCRDYPDAPRLVASPDHRNAASLRVLAKCGFAPGLWIDMPGAVGQPLVTEVVCTLDRHHWFGWPP